MEINFKNGESKIIECFVDDGIEASIQQVGEQQMFATLTGGMDYKY